MSDHRPAHREDPFISDSDPVRKAAHKALRAFNIDLKKAFGDELHLTMESTDFVLTGIESVATNLRDVVYRCVEVAIKNAGLETGPRLMVPKQPHPALKDPPKALWRVYHPTTLPVQPTLVFLTACPTCLWVGFKEGEPCSVCRFHASVIALVKQHPEGCSRYTIKQKCEHLVTDPEHEVERSLSYLVDRGQLSRFFDDHGDYVYGVPQDAPKGSVH